METSTLLSQMGGAALIPIAAPTPPGNFVNRVINADCLEVLPMLPDRSIDFVLTDPPYLSRYCDRTGRTVANDDRDRWLFPAFAELHRVLKDRSFCVSFYGWSKIDRFFAAWRAAGFRPVGHLVWPKRYASAERFLGYCHEQAYLLAKGIRRSPKRGSATSSPGGTPATGCTRRRNRSPR